MVNEDDGKSTVMKDDRHYRHYNDKETVAKLKDRVSAARSEASNQQSLSASTINSRRFRRIHQ